MSKLRGLFPLLLFLLFTSSCKANTPIDSDSSSMENSPINSAANATTQVELLNFGNRSYIVRSSESYSTIYDKGMLEIKNGMLYYAAMGSERSVIMCQNLSCMHKHSSTDTNIPATCDAEVPNDAAEGIALCIEDDIYTITFGIEEESGIAGLFLDRRSLNNGGWKNISFIPEVMLGTGEVICYQLVDEGKVYLAAKKLVYYETAIGDLCNSCYGLMELDLASGKHSMVFPFQDDLYQNVYYLNKIGNEFVYCYVSSPKSILEEIKESDYNAMGAALLSNATTKIVYIDAATMEVTSKEEFISDKENETGYFVDCNGRGVLYIDHDDVCWKKHHAQTAVKLFSITKGDKLVTLSYNDIARIYVQPKNAASASAVYDISVDGIVTKQDKYLKPHDRGYCFENGYSFVSFQEDENFSYWLVNDDVWKENILPEKSYLIAKP